MIFSLKKYKSAKKIQDPIIILPQNQTIIEVKSPNVFPIQKNPKIEKKSSILQDLDIFPIKKQTHIEKDSNVEKQPLKLQKRIIVPTYSRDLYNILNSNINCKKTIVIVLDYSNGFGDFLRGSILMAQYAKYYNPFYQIEKKIPFTNTSEGLNINFKINVSKHHISKYLHCECEELPNTENINTIHYTTDNNKIILMNSLMKKFINSNEENLYITTNLFYNINLVTQDIKDYINSFFTFKQKYYDETNDILTSLTGGIKLEKYNILHIRCKDENFNTDFEDYNLISEIIKLQLSENTIIISNNYSIKRKINKLFGFYYIDKFAFHSANIDESNDFESTIIEYIILSKSSHTYCFSYYYHGSGFSEQCSVLNNIPYDVVYLPEINVFQPNSIDLLLNHYDNLLEGHINHNEKNIQIRYENRDENNISFITLTNNGYVNYTLNCLESLKKIKMKKQLKVYCIGEEGYRVFKENENICEFIKDENATDFQEFRKLKWSNITFYKFEIIYNNLLNNEYVCITDGDIVYENNQIFSYLLNNIKDNDLLIQSEGIYNNDLCSGFMFIKSNENTIALFNPDNVKKYRNKEGWDDQIYMNAIKYKLKFKKLPLSLFPTGKYYYEYHDNIQPFLIHFNWIVGHEKKNKMAQYNKWYINSNL